MHAQTETLTNTHVSAFAIASEYVLHQTHAPALRRVVQRPHGTWCAARPGAASSSGTLRRSESEEIAGGPRSFPPRHRVFLEGAHREGHCLLDSWECPYRRHSATFQSAVSLGHAAARRQRRCSLFAGPEILHLSAPCRGLHGVWR